MAPAPCNYLLKTLEDKRKKLTKLAQEQPRDRWAAKAGHGPHEPGSLQCPGLAAGQQVPWIGMCRGSQRRTLPRMCAGQGWKARGCVSEQCCPPMALAQPAHCWTQPTPLKCFTPRTGRQQGGGDEPLVTLPGLGPLKLYFQMTDPAGSAHTQPSPA